MTAWAGDFVDLSYDWLMPEVCRAISGDRLCPVGSSQMSDVHLPSSRLGIQAACLAVGASWGRRKEHSDYILGR